MCSATSTVALLVRRSTIRVQVKTVLPGYHEKKDEDEVMQVVYSNYPQIIASI